MRPRTAQRPGFTLIELLTVIGIISLLIGILVPSIVAARDQARRLRARTTLLAIETGLQAFHNDFGKYPVSARAVDPISDFPSERPGAMEGLHWLARAMLGHDGQGVDAAGKSLDKYAELTMAQLASVSRKGRYIQNVKWVRDTDRMFADTASPDCGRTGRTILVDGGYESPILYYRANPGAPEPFSLSGSGSKDPGTYPDRNGVYNLFDNQHATGRWDGGGASGLPGWDFGNTGIHPHPLGAFGSTAPASIATPPPFYPNGKTFTWSLHDNGVLGLGVVRPHNPDSFVLITAGKDGLYGTADDITNF